MKESALKISLNKYLFIRFMRAEINLELNILLFSQKQKFIATQKHKKKYSFRCYFEFVARNGKMFETKRNNNKNNIK
jgi:hypothetical protein